MKLVWQTLALGFRISVKEGRGKKNHTEGAAIPVTQGTPRVLIPAILRAGITPLSAVVCSPDKVT